ncbi:hypothetical protein [Streptomyces sp. NPDC008265]|uniref:hypothetical protein n=1 Tax=Streptomyces sp. NPDC008265 TaxID=3364824 RepID=UPI0036E0EF5D
MPFSTEAQVAAGCKLTGGSWRIDRLPVAEEHRAGYERDLCKHWNKGLNSGARASGLNALDGLT